MLKFIIDINLKFDGCKRNFGFRKMKWLCCKYLILCFFLILFILEWIYVICFFLFIFNCIIWLFIKDINGEIINVGLFDKYVGIW